MRHRRPEMDQLPILVMCSSSNTATLVLDMKGETANLPVMCGVVASLLVP